MEEQQQRNNNSLEYVHGIDYIPTSSGFYLVNNPHKQLNESGFTNSITSEEFIVTDENPTPISEDDIPEGRQNPKCQQLTLRQGLILGTVIFTILTASLVIGLVFSSDNVRNGSPSSSLPDGATAAPSLAASLLTMEDLKVLILSKSPTSSFADPSSPQSKALAWVVSDAYTQSAAVWQEDEIILVQRFVLATFWFSTVGESWISNNNWMEAIGECSWDYVTCDEETESSITHLNVMANKLRGTIPPELALLSKLEVLDLSQNTIQGTIPEELMNMRQLEYLHLRGNLLSGTIPSNLPALRRLKELLLSLNTLSGSIDVVTELGDSIERIELDANGFRGTIPETIYQLTNLVELGLSANTFQGSLSSNVGELSHLTTLRVASNQLTGPIPTTIGLLTAIEYVYANVNHFTGTIPSEIGNMSPLKTLLLVHNDLTGSLPFELGQLVNMEELLLSVNAITGTVPGDVLVNMTKLVELDIFGTQMTGSMPSSLCSHVSPRVSCRSITCDCCICP